MTTDTSSMELRRNAQKAVVGLFDLNTSSLSLLIRNVPKKQQDDADRIIKAHLQVGVAWPLTQWHMHESTSCVDGTHTHTHTHRRHLPLEMKKLAHRRGQSQELR